MTEIKPSTAVLNKDTTYIARNEYGVFVRFNEIQILNNKVILSLNGTEIAAIDKQTGPLKLAGFFGHLMLEYPTCL
jgi:hypothetical protein